MNEGRLLGLYTKLSILLLHWQHLRWNQAQRQVLNVMYKGYENGDWYGQMVQFTKRLRIYRA